MSTTHVLSASLCFRIAPMGAEHGLDADVSRHNALFMDACKTYRHCHLSTEPDKIRIALQQLNRMTGTCAASMQNHSSVLLRPGAMRSLITVLPFWGSLIPSDDGSLCTIWKPRGSSRRTTRREHRSKTFCEAV